MGMGREKQHSCRIFLLSVYLPAVSELGAHCSGSSTQGHRGVSWFSEAQLATLWGNTAAAYQPGSSCILSSREIQLTCFLLHLVFLVSKSITWKTF